MSSNKNMQLNHYNTSFIKKTFPITLVCDNISNAPNIGSLFRTADTFGVEKLMLCGENISLGRKTSKTSRATEQVINYEIVDDASQYITNLKKSDYTIVSLEITNDSIPLHSFNFNLEKPIVLCLGDENFGISEDILKRSDAVLHIDMFGQNSSMNVVQAATIALYEITKQFR